MTERYPEDIECIIEPTNGKGGIFISNLEAAENSKTILKLGIAAVVSAAKGYILKHDPSVLSWYLYLPADDHESFNIAKYFDESFNFIDKFIKETNVLVHCLAGVSRSVSLVIAYLMRKHDYSYKKAYCLVKSRRNKIYPNDGFVNQLRKLESQLTRDKTYSICSAEFYKCRSNGDLLGNNINAQTKQPKSYLNHTFSKENLNSTVDKQVGTYDKKLWKQIQGLQLPKFIVEAQSTIKQKNAGYGVMKKQIENIQSEIQMLKKKLNNKSAKPSVHEACKITDLYAEHRTVRSPLSRLSQN